MPASEFAQYSRGLANLPESECCNHDSERSEPKDERRKGAPFAPIYVHWSSQTTLHAAGCQHATYLIAQLKTLNAEASYSTYRPAKFFVCFSHVSVV